ncbi:E3 ubiquitin-protein ligase TRIM21 [Lates calcarifer]|uniref:E3 ubiquitin-protein ligase TRIM21 n=1 Tax=Lates calcarifer TaxID=8187 RepID=A0AAJ7PDC0_LATCA|nr:E3 ubiquitin-protein ligase TRIM21 [Lates calcarifer]XP_018518078.2 E3 ubiquitin-protein ligase TRIM21 [Lates calcarifer]
MSLQVCHCCGWSKVTSYQGLRVHQGKMGCTPKGMRIPENEQFRVNSYVPQFTFMRPTIKIEEPVMDIFTSSLRPDSTSDMSLQVCHCGWSEFTTKHVLRIHQMSCRPKAISIPESEKKDSRPVNSTLVKTENGPNLFAQPNLKVNEAAVIGMIKSFIENQQHSAQMNANVDTSHRALDFNTGAQPVMPVSQTFTTQTYPAITEVTVEETNKPFFETPQRSHQSNTNSDKARRVLDFSTGAQQVEHMSWRPPTTTAQDIAVLLKEKEMKREKEREMEREREKEREKEREAQKLLKAKQDRKRAELQLKIQIREHKLGEVRSSVKGCKGSLDAEWLEINNAFTEVMKVVEDAWLKALQPLEERRRKVKREAQDLVEKLEREVDKLKKTVDELDKNPDVQVSLDESRDWKNLSLDTSFSFGSLRTTTSTMMEQICLELEKLSSVELRRIPTFAVDVKLDPATAHQCLLLSDDGKKVKDGGKNQRVPDSPKRFDMFGSILGLNSLTSGKSYWEVDVSNKTGWDLGVARGDANRKGKLLLNPDNGYWVTVHYEDKQYAALTAPPVSLSLRKKAKKVGVFVDYEEGLVSFYDVTTQSHIYSFTGCSFGGEIFPYFSPHLQQNGKNSDPLIILPVKRQ